MTGNNDDNNNNNTSSSSNNNNKKKKYHKLPLEQDGRKLITKQFGRLIFLPGSATITVPRLFRDVDAHFVGAVWKIQFVRALPKSQKPSADDIDNPPKAWVCTTCRRMFGSWHGVTNHVRTAHAPQPQPAAVENNNNDADLDSNNQQSQQLDNNNNFINNTIRITLTPCGKNH